MSSDPSVSDYERRAGSLATENTIPTIIVCQERRRSRLGEASTETQEGPEL